MKHMERTYTDTTGKLARDSEVASPTVALYAELGLLDYIRSSNGARLFRAGQADQVRQIYAERMANRGRRGNRAQVPA
jgi:DNA-binding transcriptional MerR regulator